MENREVGSNKSNKVNMFKRDKWSHTAKCGEEKLKDAEKHATHLYTIKKVCWCKHAH